MHQIFSTTERLKIIKYIIFKETPLSVNSIANELHISKGLVSKYFALLLAEGIVKRSDKKYIILDSSITKAIKILLNISGIKTTIFKKFNFIKSVGLYGSCAKGENTEKSDVDIWLFIQDVRDEQIASLNTEISNTIKNVQPIFFTQKKLETIKQDDQLFYHSLFFGSIIIYGEKDAI
jgi:predicted nucleotidyltransferase